jgi:hypothetical protein
MENCSEEYKVEYDNMADTITKEYIKVIYETKNFWNIKVSNPDKLKKLNDVIIDVLFDDVKPHSENAINFMIDLKMKLSKEQIIEKYKTFSTKALTDDNYIYYEYLNIGSGSESEMLQVIKQNKKYFNITIGIFIELINNTLNFSNYITKNPRYGLNEDDDEDDENEEDDYLYNEGGRFEPINNLDTTLPTMFNTFWEIVSDRVNIMYSDDKIDTKPACELFTPQ